MCYIVSIIRMTRDPWDPIGCNQGSLFNLNTSPPLVRKQRTNASSKIAGAWPVFPCPVGESDMRHLGMVLGFKDGVVLVSVLVAGSVVITLVGAGEPLARIPCSRCGSGSSI